MLKLLNHTLALTPKSFEVSLFALESNLSGIKHVYGAR